MKQRDEKANVKDWDVSEANKQEELCHSMGEDRGVKRAMHHERRQ